MAANVRISWAQLQTAPPKPAVRLSWAKFTTTNIPAVVRLSYAQLHTLGNPAAINVWVRVNGAWKPVVAIRQRSGGTW